MPELIIVFFIMIFASSIHSLAGFGFSMIAVPLMNLVLPIKTIVPILLFYGLLLNLIMLIQIRRHIQIKKMLSILITGIIGTPLGIYILLIIDERPLKILVGVLVLISAYALWRGRRIDIKNVKIANGVTGFLSGLLNGSLTMSGPPVILFLKNEDSEKHVFRANMAFYFAFLDIISIPMFLAGGLLTRKVISYSAFLLPALILGSIIGISLANKIDNAIFKRLTLVLIFIMGTISLVSGVF